MEDIHRDGLKFLYLFLIIKNYFFIRSSMNEWLIERIYEKQSKTDEEDVSSGNFNTANGGIIYEIVCLLKYIGFEHVSSVSFEGTQYENLEKLDSSLRLKNEFSSSNQKKCSDGTGDISNNTGTTEIGLDFEELFDCIYITVTSNSLTPFAVTNSSRSSSAIISS